MGTNPSMADQSLGAYMMRLRDPKTGQPLPDERLLPHIGMICKLHELSLNLSLQLVLVWLLACTFLSSACATCLRLKTPLQVFVDCSGTFVLCRFCWNGHHCAHDGMGFVRISNPCMLALLVTRYLATVQLVQYWCAFVTVLWCRNRFFIVTHPEVEAKVCAELEAHGLLASPDTPTPRAVAFEDLSGLVYLGAAIKVLLYRKCASMSCHAPPLQWTRAVHSALQQQLFGTVEGFCSRKFSCAVSWRCMRRRLCV